MLLEPLALELIGLGANVLPVAGGRVGLPYLLDQTGEVPQAGDRHGWLAIEHRDVFAGTAEPDGSLELFERDPALMEILRQALVVDDIAGGFFCLWANLFFVWVSLNEQKWVISRERRGQKPTRIATRQQQVT